MLESDVVIVGGGIAGATAAAMLGRAGISTILVDRHSAPRPDFRCEKLEEGQITRLKRTGLAETIFAATTPSEQLWIARYGVVIDRRTDRQINARYEVMVEAMRGAIQAPATFQVGQVVDIALAASRQTITLDDGSVISARLVVLACGLSERLGHTLGLTRELLSPCHSVSVGFDMRPAGPAAFPFRALTWYPARSAQKIGYLTLFPIGQTTRANLFVYRQVQDPWLRALHEAPRETLQAALPGLERVSGPYEVSSAVRVRSADLYQARGVERAGIVLVGDAFATSCPAAGTGLDKVLTDVERLCTVYIPRWLASPGMGADKIAAFYADPEKRACDAWSLERAYQARTAATGHSLRAQLRRRLVFISQLGAGMARKLTTSVPPTARKPTPD